jgi:tRNA U54 and U55 pseudouridine synthase Pus10
MDVRMLGGGRPFVMEILNQRAQMPTPDYFAEVEKQLKEVCDSQLFYNSC